MTTWTADELERISTADELDIAPQRRDGSLRKPTTIWVVRDGDNLFVRSWRGSDGMWFRTADSSRAGRVSAGGVTRDVTFAEEADPAVNDRIDAAYRSKYGHYSGYVEPMVANTARATTLKLLPC
ncbi:hypothetical protein HD597_004157 [Nonomuraea thailandensis]|uniref:DUF2255 family protein n=1 Tax=Nonomuraea thailandensis TaxID=1188745 RepID=A0A9X2GE68_9ACTN|nr:DUF2255 family protein [Nonomuraea thailandensis]MCP2357137.1 hypothetical protein [Nonomuraea thailandensis]